MPPRSSLYLLLLVSTDVVFSIGDVHTSLAAVTRLARAEEKVVTLLSQHLLQHHDDTVRSYVDSWLGSKVTLTSNPVSSYHFLRRLVLDYNDVITALEKNASKQDNEVLRRNLTEARQGLVLPSLADLDGAAYALVRLQNIYDLPLDELINGKIGDSPPAAKLTVNDCVRLAQQSFTNLEFDLSDKWIRKAMDLLRNEGKGRWDGGEDELTIGELEETIEKRKKMRTLIEQLAIDSPDAVLDNFSGLGIPTSFQKTMYSMREGAEQIGQLSEYYQRLCRGELLQSEEVLSTFGCGYVFRNEGYGRIMPFKAELIFHDPVLVLYHDVISDSEIEKIKSMTEPNLQTTEVHSFINYKKMKSQARIGKTAWVYPGDDASTDNVLRRIQDMTGLTTKTAEAFHVLNYGVGGHYDAHVDFFDLANKSKNYRSDEGDRIATVLFYLNDVEAGGATVFPSIGLSVPAKKGTALFWLNLKRSGQGDYRTLHASCPVLLGEKWIANLWLREEGQEFLWPCSLNKDE